MEGNFANNQYANQNAKVAPMRAPGAAGKRKRESFDFEAVNPAPNVRKAITSAYPDNTLPTSHAGDMSDFLTQTFDLSALQSHPASDPNLQQQEGGQYLDKNSGNGNLDTATAAVNRASAAMRQQQFNVPAHQAEDFLATQNVADSTFNMESAQPDAGEIEDTDAAAVGDVEQTSDNASGPVSGKPNVGTDEWHKVRKDNHKEVERRRRETINEGINELAKIVPGSEKNKGAILSRAVSYIQKLLDDNNQNIDKWTFEKLITEQAINDLSAKLTRAWNEKEFWKRAARDAGVNMDAALANLGLELEGVVVANANADADADAANDAQINGKTERAQGVEDLGDEHHAQDPESSQAPDLGV